jgi:S-DNA-T family DNA segregation ATPase FtsK/SpoIIIE
VAGDGIASLHFGAMGGVSPTDTGPGGILGNMLRDGLVMPFSFVGTTLFLLAIFMTGVTLATGLSWLTLMDRTGALTLDLVGRLQTRFGHMREEKAARQLRQQRSEAVKEEQELKKTRTPPRRWRRCRARSR